MSYNLTIAAAVTLAGSQTGVSPNAVHFDCIGNGTTTGSVSSLYSTATEQFRKTWVFFDYDDNHPVSGGTNTWSHGADLTRLRTKSKGAIGTHVFERDFGTGNRIANVIAYGT